MLTLKERTFPSIFIRSLCCRVVGHEIADTTWTRWRSWKEVPERLRDLSGDQAIDLIAIAIARSEATSPHTQLSACDIIERRPKASALLLSFIEWLDAQYVPKRHAIEWLITVRNRRISRSTLYRKIPDIKKRQLIPVEMLEAISA